jgi:hypothetical protein
LLLPVMEGLLKYESLIDGTVDLCDVALLNDALSVKRENEARVQDHMEKSKR